MIDLETLKANTDLLALAGHDTSLKKIATTGGGEYAGPCPFCSGTDRFRVQPESRRWLCRNCTGGKWQDAIAYVQKRDGCDFKQACQALGAGDLPIFCNLTKAGKPTGNPLDSSVIGRLVAEYGNRAGLAPLHGENRLAPHDLRRTCARNAYENGAKLPQIQALLGHSDVKTTMIYIGADENPDDTAIDKISYS